MRDLINILCESENNCSLENVAHFIEQNFTSGTQPLAYDWTGTIVKVLEKMGVQKIGNLTVEEDFIESQADFNTFFKWLNENSNRTEFFKIFAQILQPSIDFYKDLFKSGSVLLHRVMSVDEGYSEKFKQHTTIPMGVCWSYNSDNSWGAGRYGAKEKHSEVYVAAMVKKESVDWASTMIFHCEHGDFENEVHLLPGEQITITEMQINRKPVSIRDFVATTVS
jgi:hypothetical protein